MTLLSIHLITYNNEQHIEETIQSILKQKVDFDYEIVVGDDCSTDNTLQIINEHRDRHPKLFKIKKNKTQLGILKNFKATLDRCQGEFVFDIAGDDMLKTNDALQSMVDVLQSDSSLGFVDSGYDKLYEGSFKKITFCNKKLIGSSKELYKQKLQLGLITPVGICFRKTFLYQFVDFDTYLNQNITIEDYPILIDLAMNTDFALINKSLHIYRVHNDSYSHKKTFENHLFLKKQMKKLFEYFSEKYSFDSLVINTFKTNYYKELLFLSGYFEKRELGKEMFNKLKSKSIKDYIHYWASQSKMFRKLISII